MNSPVQDPGRLDTFERGLLAELRREVAEHPAPAPGRHPRRRLKLVAAGAIATSAATIVAVGMTGSGPTASPAFAVTGNSDGSVDLVVHRLDDADGIEAALAAHGIDATVHFVAMPEGHMPAEPKVDGPLSQVKPGPGNPCGIDDGPGPVMLARGDAVGPLGKEGVGTGADLGDGGDFVLDFPADSPALDRTVVLDVGSRGSFWITYPSATAGEWCRYGQTESLPDPGTYQVG